MGGSCCCDGYRGDDEGHVGCIVLAFLYYFAARGGRGSECCDFRDSDCFDCSVASCRNSGEGGSGIRQSWAQSGFARHTSQFL